jgi:hypothetical protein
MGQRALYYILPPVGKVAGRECSFVWLVCAGCFVCRGAGRLSGQGQVHQAQAAAVRGGRILQSAAGCVSCLLWSVAVLVLPSAKSDALCNIRSGRML